jgi:hypothetical protein
MAEPGVGEVLERIFEEELRKSFPDDDIAAIRTGSNGADILQTVRAAQGTACGRILWEVKRTANYSKQWIAKLKQDQRENGAELAVILTQALPRDIAQFAEHEGVWVTGYSCGLPLAAGLRQGLIEAAALRRSEEGKNEKKAFLYRYLTGTEFRHRIGALVDGFLALKTSLEQERAALQRVWKNREKALNGLLLGTAAFYGDLQGIIGAVALPEIRALAIDHAEDNGEERLPGSSD